MTTDEFMKGMTGLIMDINPAEIASHIEIGNLKEWCMAWQNAAKMALVQAPLKWENKE